MCSPYAFKCKLDYTITTFHVLYHLMYVLIVCKEKCTRLVCIYPCINSVAETVVNF